MQKGKNKTVFEIEGLYPGYGVTIGNSLRRVLLSSLHGAAVTEVKIKGASHEFSTLPGILEDVVMYCPSSLAKALPLNPRLNPKFAK